MSTRTNTVAGLMSGILRRRPSGAMVVAFVALLLAMGGTGYAAITLPKNSVGAKQLKKNAVTSSKVKNGSLTLRDFKSSERAKLRGSRGPTGPQGAPGVPGTPGRNGVTDITYVDGPVITIGPGASAGTYAECPAGSIATGGGIGPATESQLLPIDAYTISGGGFGVFAVNPDSTSRTLQARAACARR